MSRSCRRSSVFSSTHSAMQSRRSSVSLKDIERIQILVAQKKRKLPTQVAICLLWAAPVFVFAHTFIFNHCNGSPIELLIALWRRSESLGTIIPLPFSSTSFKIITFVILVQLIFCLILPAENVLVINNNGEREQKAVNAFNSCVLINLLFILGATVGFYNGSIVYHHWPDILATLNITSIAAVVALQAWRCHCDQVSFNSISDFVFGNSLNPTIDGVDLRHFAVYRIGLTIWPLYIVSAIYYNHSTSEHINADLLACALLQLVYIAKIQWFEHLRYSQLHFQSDRTGLSFIWTTIVLLPAFYVTPITLLARRSTSLPIIGTLVLIAFGLLAQYLTVKIDRQRINFRLANGNVKVWNTDPFFITAKFRRSNGEIGANLLLGSGFWSFCRHPNYLSEWFSYFAWTMLQGLQTTFYSYFPIVFLAVFLHLRMSRDELRCLAKYGPYWLQYRNRVMHLLIPSIY